MIASMTGYGRGTSGRDGASVTVEIRSVNGRQREVRCRMPQALLPLEADLRERIMARIARGRVDVWVTWDHEGAQKTAYALNLDGARAMHAAWRELRDEFQLPDEPSAGALLRLPGVVEQSAPPRVDPDEIRPMLARAADAALDELDEGRRTEGRALLDDMTRRLGEIGARLGRVRACLAGEPERVAQQLRERVERLLADAGLDEARLAQEIAILAQRADVTEELVRLDAHVSRLAAKLVPEGGEIGREAEFVVQEMRREINTLGVKSSSPEVDDEVIAIKAELEKIREQAANVE